MLNKLKQHKWLVGAVASVVILAGASVYAADAPMQSFSPNQVVQCVVQGSCVFEAAEQVFGVTNAGRATTWISGIFTEDVDVEDELTVGGDLTVSGTSTFSGLISGAITSLEIDMSSSATTTACTSLNATGNSRVVTGLQLFDTGTDASTGAVLWEAGTSTTNGANGASTPTATVAIDTTITRVSGRDVVTPTSTAQSATLIWPTGTYMNFISSTTTNAGTCHVQYFTPS